MLSTGTLNLKFMQRNNQNQNQNPNPKPKSEENTSNSTTTKTKTKTSQKTPILIDPPTAPYQSNSNLNLQNSDQLFKDQFRTPSSVGLTLSIVFEDSLIGFPPLSFRRHSPIIPGSSSSNLPAHIGRKSYGQFNSAIQKLGNLDETSSKQAEHGSNTTRVKNHKKLKTEKAEQSRKSSASKQSREEINSNPEGVQKSEISSASIKTTTTAMAKQKRSKEVFKVEEETESSLDHHQKIRSSSKDSNRVIGFQKPYQSTTIKSKRIGIDLATNSSESTVKSTASSKDINPPSSSKGSSQSAQHFNSLKNSNQLTNQQQPVIIDSDDGYNDLDQKDEDQISDDSETVNQQIEIMFKEARNAHKI